MDPYQFIVLIAKVDKKLEMGPYQFSVNCIQHP